MRSRKRSATRKKRAENRAEKIGIAARHGKLVHWFPYWAPHHFIPESMRSVLSRLRAGITEFDEPQCGVGRENMIDITDRRASDKFSRVTCLACIASYERGFM